MRMASLALAFAAAILPAATMAQVVTDGSVGARVTLTGPAIGIPDSLGLRVGPNLLHSFSVFNVARGETATFTGVGGIQNIIARITGGSPSAIDGALRSSITSSNLFLVNPSGIVFGPNASINVPGSFYASTAHYLRLADGTRVEMRASPGVTLTAAPPAAFGFEGTAAAIALTGTQIRVAEGNRIGLAGGDISLGRASNGRVSVLSAPSGAIGVVAAQSAGEAVIGPGGLYADGFGAMGSIALSPGSLVSANEGPARHGGGAISIAGGAVDIDHANVESRTRYADGRGIAISGSQSLTVRAGNVISVTTGAGNAGPLHLEGGDVTLSGGSLVDTSCDPGCTTGAGGALSVAATGALRILGDDEALTTYLVSNSFGDGRTGPIDIRAGAFFASGNALVQAIPTEGTAGQGSTITLTTGSISLEGGAQVDVSVRGSGHGGNLVVNNAGAITIDGTRLSDPATGLKLPSGFFANAEGSGAAGNIVISTATLEVLNGGEVSSSSRRGASAAGGRISIAASGLVRVAGTDSDGKSAGIVSNTFTAANAGDIEIAADRVEVADDGRIQVQSEGAGRAGSLRIAAGTMALSSRGQVSSDARAGGDGGDVEVTLTGKLQISDGNSGLFAKTYGSARGGSVNVEAGGITIDGGGIFAGTDGTGRGGDVSAHSSGDAEIANQGSVSVETRAAGAAGTLRFAADGSLSVRDGGRITAQSQSTGSGGAVAVAAGRSITVEDDGRISAETLSSGDGGSVSVSAGDALTLARDGRITTQSAATGLAGSITVRAGDMLSIVDGGRITTSALQADGGDVSVTSGRLAVMSSGRITTEVGTGQGSGGNVNLQVPTLVMSGSVITANAFGGDGGNIRIGTTTFVPSADSHVTASSTLGIDGTITFESPAIDPTGELLVPPPAFVDAGSVLAGRCGPRLAGRASSLVVMPGGMVRAPDGWTVDWPAKGGRTAGRRKGRLGAIARLRGEAGRATRFRRSCGNGAMSNAMARPGASCLFGLAALWAGMAGASLPPVPAPSEFERELVQSRVMVRHIVVEGARAIAEGDIRAAVAGFEGRALAEGDFREIERRLTQLYLDRGFAASGVLLKSRPGPDGDAVFVAVEGAVSQVRFRSPPRYANAAWLTSRLVPSPTEPVRLDDLQDRMTMLRESGVVERINAELVPLPTGGAAELVVSVEERRPWDAQLRYDNYHSPVIGARRPSLWLEHRNLTGWGDRIEGHVGRTEGLDDYHVAYSVPWARTPWRFGARFEKSDSLAVDPPAFRELEIASITDTRRGEVSYAWLETVARSLTTSLAVERRSGESKLLGLPFSFVPGLPDGTTEIEVARASAEYMQGGREQVLFLRGQWSEGKSRTPIGDAVGAPASRFRVFAAQGQYARQISESGAQVLVRLDGQYAPRTLVPIEKKAVGGAESVRGYRENLLLGDSALVGTIEARWPVWRWEDKARLALAVFADAGWVHDAHDRADSMPTTIASVGVGLAAVLPAGFTARIDFAYPNRRWLTEHEDSQDRGIHFRIAWNPPFPY